MVDKMDIIHFNKVIGKDYKAVLRFLTRLIHSCNTCQHLLCARHSRQSDEQGGHGFMVLQLDRQTASEYTLWIVVREWRKKFTATYRRWEAIYSGWKNEKKIIMGRVRGREWEQRVQREGSHLWSTPQGRIELCQIEWLRGCSEGSWWEMDQEGSRDRPGSHTWRIYDFILSVGIGGGRKPLKCETGIAVGVLLKDLSAALCGSE